MTSSATPSREPRTWVPSKHVLSVSGKVNAYETATVGGSKVVYVPFTAKNPTTVKQLRAGLTVGDGSVANVYRGSTKLAADAAIQAGDVLRFEVEGTSNTPIEYTIAQKNAWNWVDWFKTATGRGLELPEAEWRRR